MDLMKIINEKINKDGLLDGGSVLLELGNSISQLDRWISNNGWEGYDPYDIKGTRVFMWALGIKKNTFHNRLIRKLLLGPLLIGEMLFPRLFRRIFFVKPTINPKGMALLSQAYIKLFSITGNKIYQDKWLECINWLTNNQSAGYTHPCWGYPFDWHTHEVDIPAYTPSSVVTSAVCEAYWLAWLTTGDKSYLDFCIGACKFFMKYLNLDRIDEETVCFSYTPLDDYHVHNANLLVAELLVKVGRTVGEKEWIKIGLEAANYAITEQNKDGSLYYYGKINNSFNPNRVDHYHTGFEIRSLFSIYEQTKNPLFINAVDRYYKYYLSNFIEDNGKQIRIKMYPHSVHPINVHSCAEALLLNSTMASIYPEAQNLLEPILHWINKMMQSENGYYYYMCHKIGPINQYSTIPYMRWGQAWMLLGLVTVLESEYANLSDDH